MATIDSGSLKDWCDSLQRPCFVVLKELEPAMFPSQPRIPSFGTACEDDAKVNTPSKSVRLLDRSTENSPCRRSPRIFNKTLEKPVSGASTIEDTGVVACNDLLPVTPETLSKKGVTNFYSRARKICFDDPQPKKPAEMSPITRMCFYKKTLKRLDTIKNRVQRALAQDLHKCTLKRQRSIESTKSRSSFSKKAPQAKRRKQSKVLGSVGHRIKKMKPIPPTIPATKMNARTDKLLDNVGLVITFKKANKENVQEEAQVGNSLFCVNDIDIEAKDRKRKFFKSPGSVTLTKSMKLCNEASAPIRPNESTMEFKRKPPKVTDVERELRFEEKEDKARSQSNDDEIMAFSNSYGFADNSKENNQNTHKPWRVSLTPVKSPSSASVPVKEEPLKIQKVPEDICPRYFPVFYKRNPSTNKDQEESKESYEKKVAPPKKEKDGKKQMIIDAGQKRLGSITCHECGVLYNPGDDDDEFDHTRFHERFVQHLKFPGWQNENVVIDYLDGRVIMVSGSDNSSYWKRVEDVLEIADRDLGFSEVGIRNKSASKAFLYVSNRTVVGCLVAEKVTSGYRVLGDLDGKESVADSMSWRCSMVPRPVRCGVSRIWVAASHRRKGIASKLMDALRANFVYAELLKKECVAFSDPTPMGMSFAKKYSGTPSFLVYNK